LPAVWLNIELGVGEEGTIEGTIFQLRHGVAAALATYLNDAELDTTVQHILGKLQSKELQPDIARTYMQSVGALRWALSTHAAIAQPSCCLEGVCLELALNF